MLSLVPEPVFVVAVEHTPHFRFLYGNDAFRELVAWPEDEPVAGDLSVAFPDDTVETYEEHFAVAARDGASVSFETDVAGGRTTISVDVAPVRDGSGCTHLVCTAHDVTDRHRMQASLEYHTRHDALTQLPNRVSLVERLGDALGVAQDLGGNVALLFLDIDDFKLVNDTLGHDAGDAVLTMVARRLERVLREGDIVARFGGDEFGVICNDVECVDEAIAVADRIRHVFEQPMTLDTGQVYLTAGVGIVVSNGGEDQPERMLRDADVARFAAKAEGRGSVSVFDEHMRELMLTRLEVESALRRAIERDEFRVHYQPLVDFEQSEVTGFEALVRWEHPERGLLGPDAFLEAAERTGLIVPIGAWVFDEACRQAAAWAEESAKPLSVSVNVSERQLLAANFVDSIARALEASGLPPELLVIEVTERVLMDDRERAAEILGRLAELGVQLSVDDFGTGQSLSYLKHLPVHSLKIDRSFIDGLGADLDDAAIVAAIVALGHALGLTVTAEGIETPRQLSEVRSLGCDTGQGYYFARPQPGEVVRALVHRQIRWRERAS
ncbi:MAG TPA: EAL domain-containing protein [Acidimicrobiia bacterium]|nr:EAL domain-containing protein [Acidimicrobiia bacterium]